jgi:hypothetical protein
MFLPARRLLTIPFPPGRPPVFAPRLARVLAAVILPPLLFFAILNHPHNSFYIISISSLILGFKEISHLTLRIPIRAKTIMANTTAPRRPNKNQPIKNAITEATEILDQSIDILPATFNHLILQVASLFCFLKSYL